MQWFDFGAPTGGIIRSFDCVPPHKNWCFYGFLPNQRAEKGERGRLSGCAMVMAMEQERGFCTHYYARGGTNPWLLINALPADSGWNEEGSKTNSDACFANRTASLFFSMGAIVARFRGFFWKAARIGERLSPWVAAGCFTIGVSIIYS